MNPQDYNQNPYVAGGQNPQPTPPPSNNPYQNAQGSVYYGGQPVQPAQSPQNAQPIQPVQPAQSPQNFQPTQAFPPQQTQQASMSQPQSSLTTENPYTMEYLNSIAPKKQASFWTKGKIMLAIFAGVGIILAGLLFTLGGGGATSNKDATTKFYYNLVQIEQITQNYQKKLKNSDLAALNAGIATSISTSKNSLTSYMTSKNIEILSDTKAQKTTLYTKVAEEYAKLSTTLDDAFLKTTLDEVYAREVSYQFSVIKDSANKLKSRLNSKSADEALDPIISNLDAAIKGLNEFKK